MRRKRSIFFASVCHSRTEWEFLGYGHDGAGRLSRVALWELVSTTYVPFCSQLNGPEIRIKRRGGIGRSCQDLTDGVSRCYEARCFLLHLLAVHRVGKLQSCSALFSQTLFPSFIQCVTGCTLQFGMAVKVVNLSSSWTANPLQPSQPQQTPSTVEGVYTSPALSYPA